MTNPPPTSRWVWWTLAAVVLVAAGAGGAFWWTQTRPASPSLGSTAAAADSPASSNVSVEVVRPKAGGIPRTCNQPGTVEPFEYADLYAKASGYLTEQKVDIGSRVKAGDVLARISVPEYEKQVERDQARVRDANAKVRQMEARVRAAKAEARAAEASVALARVLVKAKAAFRSYRQKQLDRIKELVAAKALDRRLEDEQEDYYLSALEAENAAKEQVNTAQEKAAAATEQVGQAEADLDAARADVGVAEADLAKSRVLLDYTVIKSPYTGVVTKRAFHVGDFIKAADQGGIMPMLAVERTDLMRVVVQVPDRDVPYVHLGAPAVVEIDALPGVVYKSDGQKKIAVSRWDNKEDPTTRTMRTEIDVVNADGKLAHGMYGRVNMSLGQGTPNALRVPSAALVGKAEGGRGSVRVVRDGKAHVVPVRFATDNGIEAEVVSGLSPADQVIARASGPIEEGTPVTANDERPAAGH